MLASGRVTTADPFELEPRRARAELARFAGLALGAVALLHGAIAALGLPFSLSPSDPAFHLYLAGLATPSLAALVLVRSGERRAWLHRLLRPRGGSAVLAAAAFAQLAIVGLAWLLAHALGVGDGPKLAPGPGFALLAAGQLWVVLGEEPGWRGYALPRLEAWLGARRASLAIAGLWGGWHAPMFAVAGSLQREAPVALFAASILAWSAIHSVLYRHARPGVLPNLLFHASANWTLGLGLVPDALHAPLAVAYLAAAAIAWWSLGPGGGRSPRTARA